MHSSQTKRVQIIRSCARSKKNKNTDMGFFLWTDPFQCYASNLVCGSHNASNVINSHPVKQWPIGKALFRSASHFASSISWALCFLVCWFIAIATKKHCGTQYLFSHETLRKKNWTECYSILLSLSFPLAKKNGLRPNWSGFHVSMLV